MLETSLYLWVLLTNISLKLVSSAIWDGLRDRLTGALTPKPREQETQEEINAAREKQKAEGTESFFDAPPAVEPSTDEKMVVKSLVPKKKFTEVRVINALATATIDARLLVSTNILLRISRFRTGN